MLLASQNAYYIGHKPKLHRIYLYICIYIYIWDMGVESTSA